MKIQNIVGIWAFAIAVTALSVFASVLLVHLMFGASLFNHLAPRTAVIAMMITLPICLAIGFSMRQNNLLSTELRRLVSRDRLTDVSTRDFFFCRMEASPDAYGVSLMVDIDHFKRVNDSYGHLVGDDVIKHVGTILQRETREEDIVCRFGGEEFVIFLHEADGDRGLLVAERMRMLIEASPITADEKQVSVTVSIGGSMKERMDDINVSIKLADEALYRAKQTGRNRTVVDWMSPRALRNAG